MLLKSKAGETWPNRELVEAVKIANNWQLLEIFERKKKTDKHLKVCLPSVLRILRWTHDLMYSYLLNLSVCVIEARFAFLIRKV